MAFAHSNEDGAPFGLSTASLYAELARPLAEQAMPMRHAPVQDDGPSRYAEWARIGGEEDARRTPLS